MTLTVILIFVVTTVLAGALGVIGGYFFYRARHREAFAELASLDHDLAERETELRRLTYRVSTARVHTPGADETSAAALHERIESLQEEVEQRTLDLNLLRQDYDLETRILKQEIDQLRAGHHDEVRQAHRRLDAKQHQLREAREQLDAEYRARTAEREAEHKAREAALAEREADLAAHEARIDEQEAALDARETQVAAREVRADEQEAFAAAPTAQQEALLVKRLRQQIRLQEDELTRLRLGKTTPSLRPSALPEAAATAPDARTPAPRPSFSPLSSFVDGRGAAPDGQSDGQSDATDAPTATRPPRRDALTRIAGITGPVQSALYEMGFTSFEQIARLNSADVRRIAERLGLDRRTIQGRWILEAQAHLFEDEA